MIPFGEHTYCNQRRWVTYYHQINYTQQVCAEGDRVLVVGPGDYIVPKILKNSFKFDVETLDRQEDSTYTLDLRELQENSIPEYKVIVCCQVLEHIPIEFFKKTLSILVSKCKRLVLSLPLYTGKITSKEHFWELGYGNSTEEVIAFLSGFGKVITNTVEGKQFFILDKNE